MPLQSFWFRSVVAGLSIAPLAAWASAYAPSFAQEPARASSYVGTGSRADTTAVVVGDGHELRSVTTTGPAGGVTFNGSSDLYQDSEGRYKIATWPASLARNKASLEFTAKENAIARQAETLARELESAESDTKRAEIKSKLGEALGKQFDLRQEKHQKEIEALEAQVKKLKDLVEKRKENRSEIISRRLDQIVREAQGLGF
ncbi:hypothetical protein [Aquisphaera insulae]|uniref:hypothetical protein n=1 Tax=Aquisphaera insulae TaxID=2712864 RepID=UPI0013ED42CE|nr:hypothetical protein [Aquisphaera insulae]